MVPYVRLVVGALMLSSCDVRDPVDLRTTDEQQSAAAEDKHSLWIRISRSRRFRRQLITSDGKEVRQLSDWHFITKE